MHGHLPSNLLNLGHLAKKPFIYLVKFNYHDTQEKKTQRGKDTNS